MLPGILRVRFAPALLLLLWSGAAAAHPTNYAVAVTVSVEEAPPRISLHWPAVAAATKYEVSTKAWGAASWSLQATLTTNAATVTGWTDTNVTAGTVHEYMVVRTAGVTAYGFTMSAIRRPLPDSRGKVILLVDDSKAPALTNELTRLQRDLVGDGWTVLRHDITPAHWSDTNAWKAAVTNVKAIIKADYNADTGSVKAVFLFGHIPVPYSGAIYPDGHTNHAGAWPADMYYGDMSGNWTDDSVTVTLNSGRLMNVPGDGKFDQDAWPAQIDLQVGRADFYGMTSFGGLSDTNLLRQYLEKDHRYRTCVFSAEQRGLVDDNFGDFSGEAFAYDGWRNFGHMFGVSNVSEQNFFTTLATNSYTWAYGCGGGGYQSASGVGNSWDFDTYDTRVIFTMLFGSYFGDWDVGNSFLRAPLCSKSFTLSCSWGGRPDNYYHFMTLGETLGECIRQSQNNGPYPAVKDWERQLIHTALMGDPTLRLHMIVPPCAFNGIKSAGQTDLAWVPSPDEGVLGYNLYRSTSYTGTFVRLNSSPVAGTNYVDGSAPAGTLVYMLRPVKLEVSNGGSYTNMGQGVFAQIGDATNGTPSPTNQTVWTWANTPLRITLTAGDPDGDGLGYFLSSLAQHGAITGTAPNVVYRPDTNYTGADSFTFQASDGKVESDRGQVTVFVLPRYTPLGTSVQWLLDRRMGPTSDYTAIELADPDVDGLATWQEYMAGTEPTNWASVYRILDVQSYALSNVVWWFGTTNSGCTNLFGMEARTNLLDGGWNGCGTNLNRSASGTNMWADIDPPTNTPVFYRPIIH